MLVDAVRNIKRQESFRKLGNNMIENQENLKKEKFC